jgi:uncharacterized membrane protein
VIITLCLLLTSMQSSPSAEKTANANAILAKAIEASGGAEALKRARVLNWRGRETIYGVGRQTHIDGRWTVEPPDRASVTTWEVDKGESSARRMIIDGASGSMERSGKSMPMPPEMLANERDQFYLYSVLKLTPLLDPDVKLMAITEHGAPGLNVVRPGRPNVSILFDASGRPTRLRTSVLDPATKQPVAEELQFQGTVESEGIRWPRQIRILQAGKLFFELEISEFTVTK